MKNRQPTPNRVCTDSPPSPHHLCAHADLQSFNAAPYEMITHHGLGGCDDGDLSNSPSCGWVIAADGSRIPHSQGFCCSCGADQILGTSSTSTRSETLQCDLFGSSQSAHCLRFSDLWYAAYTLGPPELHFSISVEARQGSNGTLPLYRLDLSPQSPGVASPDGKVTARLLGDLAAYQQDMQPFGLTKYLFTPSQPASHPRVRAGVQSWLLVDQTAVSRDGSKCDLVGTSYSAFRHQSAGKCHNSAGSCLQNQLEDLQAADQQRIANGQTPINHVSAFGDFAPYSTSDGKQYVAYTSTTRRNSVITLTLNADAIRFLIAESDGEVSSVHVEDFEALSDMGRLIAVVKSTGRIAADFSLRVSCSDGIRDGIEARALSLIPAEQRTVTFPIFAERKNASSHFCSAELYGSRETLLSSMNVTFSTTKLVVRQGAQGGELTVGVGTGRSQLSGGVSVSNVPCQAICTGFFDLLCFLTFGCGTKMAFACLAILLPFLLCFCCCFCYRNRCCRDLLCFLGAGRPAIRHRHQTRYDYARRWQDRSHHESSNYPQRDPGYRDAYRVQHRPHEHSLRQSIRRTAMRWKGSGAWRHKGSASSHVNSPASTQTAVTSHDQHESRRRHEEHHVSREPPSVRVAKNARGIRRLSLSLQSKLASKGFRASWRTSGEQQARHRRCVYLNLDGAFASAAAHDHSADSRLRPSGPTYSLRGEMVVHPVHGEYFSLGSNYFQHWHWNRDTHRYNTEPYPTRLNRSFFRVPLYNRHGQSLEESQIITTDPRYRVINLRDEMAMPSTEPETNEGIPSEIDRRDPLKLSSNSVTA
jgi:hypothetical protein